MGESRPGFPVLSLFLVLFLWSSLSRLVDAVVRGAVFIACLIVADAIVAAGESLHPKSRFSLAEAPGDVFRFTKQPSPRIYDFESVGNEHIKRMVEADVFLREVKVLEGALDIRYYYQPGSNYSFQLIRHSVVLL